MTANPVECDDATLSCIYVHNGEMLRHFDRLKYTVWTVYTAIIAGLWVAKNAGEISVERMLLVTTVASLYFILLSSRLQRNYKLFYSSSHEIEAKLHDRLPSEVRETLPFICGGKQYGSHFWRVNRWDLVAGRIPYFYLQIVFFVMIPAGMGLLYLSK
jgi:hypothetical protein